MKTNQILQGNTSDILKTLPPESVNCCATSPPFWGLRDYGTGIWKGGKKKCDHSRRTSLKVGAVTTESMPSNSNHKKEGWLGGVCGKCGAKRIDQQLGLEPTFQEYVIKLCDIYDEIKRVLKKDGTCWVNLGDTYGGSGGAAGHTETTKNLGYTTSKMGATKGITQGLMPKCLLQIPARFSIEMCNRGWILRNVIIWHKPNCMPSSVRDRFTTDFEYLFFFTKSKKYYFEQQFEGFAESTLAGNPTRNRKHGSAFVDGTPGRSKQKGGKIVMPNKKGRNKRCVWGENANYMRLRGDLDDKTRCFVIKKLLDEGLI